MLEEGPFHVSLYTYKSVSYFTVWAHVTHYVLGTPIMCTFICVMTVLKAFTVALGS